MPVCTVFLLSLNVSLPNLFAILQRSLQRPVIVAKVVRWIVEPSRPSQKHLLQPSLPWDVLLIFEKALDSLPKELQPLVNEQWSIAAGVPSKLLSSFESINARLLHPSTEKVPSLTGALSHPRIAESSQKLELGNELRQWIVSGQGPNGPVSMLNLLTFEHGKKGEYLKYGKAFAESIGSSRGGIAKIVGKVIPGTCSDGHDEWEEVCTKH